MNLIESYFICNFCLNKAETCKKFPTGFIQIKFQFHNKLSTIINKLRNFLQTVKSTYSISVHFFILLFVVKILLFILKIHKSREKSRTVESNMTPTVRRSNDLQHRNWILSEFVAQISSILFFCVTIIADVFMMHN